MPSTHQAVTAPPSHALSVELIDAVSEAVASPRDAQARAAAICSLVQEIYETTEWVNGPNVDSYELTSLRGLVAEGLAHQNRMERDTSHTQVDSEPLTLPAQQTVRAPAPAQVA